MDFQVHDAAPGGVVTISIPDAGGAFIHTHTMQCDGFTYVYDSLLDCEETYDFMADAMVDFSTATDAKIVLIERANPNSTCGWELLVLFNPTK